MVNRIGLFEIRMSLMSISLEMLQLPSLQSSCDENASPVHYSPVKISVVIEKNWSSPSVKPLLQRNRTA
ncbi:Hypothetical predicted protein [Scomber scombrus]